MNKKMLGRDRNKSICSTQHLCMVIFSFMLLLLLMSSCPASVHVPVPIRLGGADALKLTTRKIEKLGVAMDRGVKFKPKLLKPTPRWHVYEPKVVSDTSRNP